MDPPLPPLPPINDNTVGSVNVAVELFDSDNSASAIAASVADDFFALLSARAVDRKIDFLVKEAQMTMGVSQMSRPRGVNLHRIKRAYCWMTLRRRTKCWRRGYPFRQSNRFLKIAITTKKKIKMKSATIQKATSHTLPTSKKINNKQWGVRWSKVHRMNDEPQTTNEGKPS